MDDKKIINTVNEMIGQELPSHVMGVFNVCEDNGHIVVDVETTDGVVSRIDYNLFISKAVNGKVSKEDFCECFYQEMNMDFVVLNCDNDFKITSCTKEHQYGLEVYRGTY